MSPYAIQTVCNSSPNSPTVGSFPYEMQLRPMLELQCTRMRLRVDVLNRSFPHFGWSKFIMWSWLFLEFRKTEVFFSFVTCTITQCVAYLLMQSLAAACTASPIPILYQYCLRFCLSCAVNYDYGVILRSTWASWASWGRGTVTVSDPHFAMQWAEYDGTGKSSFYYYFSSNFGFFFPFYYVQWYSWRVCGESELH